MKLQKFLLRASVARNLPINFSTKGQNFLKCHLWAEGIIK